MMRCIAPEKCGVIIFDKLFDLRKNFFRYDGLATLRTIRLRVTRVTRNRPILGVRIIEAEFYTVFIAGLF